MSCFLFEFIILTKWIPLIKQISQLKINVFNIKLSFFSFSKSSQQTAQLTLPEKWCACHKKRLITQLQNCFLSCVTVLSFDSVAILHYPWSKTDSEEPDCVLDKCPFRQTPQWQSETSHIKNTSQRSTQQASVGGKHLNIQRKKHNKLTLRIN